MRGAVSLMVGVLLLGCDPELEAGDPIITPGDVLVIGDGEPPRDAGLDARVPTDADPTPRDARPPDLDGGHSEDAGPDGAPTVDRGPPPRDARPPVDDAAPPPPAEGPATYVAGPLHSPITPFVRDGLRAIAARDPGRAEDVFAKIGDSLTVSNAFLKCFPTNGVDLAGRDHLRRTIDHFADGRAGGTDPFRRDSEAAVVGWSASAALAGNPSPIDRELAALDPRFAVVMFGTNDIQRRDLVSYAEQMFDIVDLLMSQGVIPLLSSVPPRGDSRAADDLVPSYNAVVRGIAQGRQIPFMDLEGALRPLPDYGLAGDNLHGSTYRDANGSYRACVFTPAGLEHGYNWRNLLTIESLHRVVETVLDDRPPPDAPEPARVAEGSPDDPILIEGFPFTHLGDSREARSRAFDTYPGCNADQDESGPEYVYRLDLDRPTTLRAYVFDRDGVDIDIHLLGEPDPRACLDRDHHGFAASLDPGTWYFVLDTFVGADGQPDAGEFLFVLVADG